ncbi:MAG: hypothetical protein IPP64_08135 [Bacteroidetes bacterium]|nr:hypothetical protein [Bacteroidota bacterium]
MSSFKEKSYGFIIGILVGLIIAGGFFIFKLDDYFKELSFYKSVSNTFSSESKSEDVPSKETTPVEKTKKSKTKVADFSKNQEAINEEKVVKVDTNSIAKDTLTLENPGGDDVMVVRKDELLLTKTLEVFNLDPVAKMNGKDSLLQKVSGIKDDKPAAKQYMNLELWSSPLNYKGYKMSKYKLIMYGIASPEGLKIYRLDDVVYIKSASLVYRVDATGEFKPYERITDESVISRLK